MKRTVTIITCDLCGHVSDPERPPTIRPMATLKFHGTDQAGHDETLEKEICEECRETIALLQTLRQ